MRQGPYEIIAKLNIFMKNLAFHAVEGEKLVSQ